MVRALNAPAVLLLGGMVLLGGGCGRSSGSGTGRTTWIPAATPARAACKETALGPRAAPVARSGSIAPSADMAAALPEAGLSLGHLANPGRVHFDASWPDARSPAPVPQAVVRRTEPSDRFRAPLQSGTLTAGSVDDHEHFDQYQRYLSEAMQQDPSERLLRLDLGRRVVIRVENGQGDPVCDARVVVRPATENVPHSPHQPDPPPVLLDVLTGSDGRALFLPGIDGAAEHRKFSISVSAPGTTESVTHIMDVDSPLWKVCLPNQPERHVTRLDLALVIDTTGSMSDELEYLKVEIDSIAHRIHQMFPNVDQRYALIVYRDQGDQYVTRTFDFTGSLEGFRSTLSQQHAEGGGDYPEAVHLALAEANKLSWRTDRTARVLFLIADAPPHEQFSRQAMEEVGQLRRRTVRVYPVGGSGVAQQAEFLFRAAAFVTQGQYLFLTDHSGVGNPHASPHVPEFAVERLDRLMVRMIASELAGRRVPATEILTIEKNRSPQNPTPPTPPDPPEQPPTRNPPALPMQPEPAARAAGPGALPTWMTHWAVLGGLLLAGMLAQDYVSRRPTKR